MRNRAEELSKIVEETYAMFAKYQRPKAIDFCGHCYEPREVAYYQATPLREIAAEPARRLVWETADHWTNTEVYKHYLPRILEALAPPDASEDIFPEHFFEVLNFHGFCSWPEEERKLLLGYIAVVAEQLRSESEESAREWVDAVKTLRQEPMT